MKNPIRKKASNIKSIMRYRTKELCNWTIDEFLEKFDNLNGHGTLWQIDHIHPIHKKNEYNGNINDLENLQKLNLKEHKDKTKIDTVENYHFLVLSNEIKIKNSKEKLHNILENWDFTTLGKISIRKIAKKNKINIKTVAKYWPEFKDYALILNNKFKNRL